MSALLSRIAVGLTNAFALRPGINAGVTYPTDEPRIHVAGPNPDRILFYGSGVVAGYGVGSFRSSILGHTARQIAVLTGRGVDVQGVSEPNMTIRSAASGVGRLHLARFDAIVIILGVNDIFLRTSVEAWSDGVTALLNAIAASGPASCCVFFVAIADPAHSQLYRRSLIASASTRVHAFNRATHRAVAEHPDAVVLDFEIGPTEPGDSKVMSDAHARWATQLAGPIAERLDEGFASGLTGAGYGSFAEPERQKAVDRLGIVDTSPEDRFDRIVRTARAMFRTESATFAVIDHDRAWLKSSVGVELSQVERTISFCNSTLGQPNGLEVPNAESDPRFATNPLVTDDPHVRFYLGYPVESRDGYPVGVLCVFDSKPRDHDPESVTRLRELAVLIGRELDR